MRGRKPKPTTLKVLAGNPGHRALNDREPPAPDDAPEPPDCLDAEGQAEWHRVTACLRQMGLLTAADRTALMAYCLAYSRWLQAEKQVQKFGTIDTNIDRADNCKGPLFACDERVVGTLKFTF